MLLEISDSELEPVERVTEKTKPLIAEIAEETSNQPIIAVFMIDDERTLDSAADRATSRLLDEEVIARATCLRPVDEKVFSHASRHIWGALFKSQGTCGKGRILDELGEREDNDPIGRPIRPRDR